MRAAQAAILAPKVGLRQAQARQILRRARRGATSSWCRCVSSEEPSPRASRSWPWPMPSLAGAARDASRLRAELRRCAPARQPAPAGPRGRPGGHATPTPAPRWWRARRWSGSSTRPACGWTRALTRSAPRAGGGLPAEVALRSRPGQPLAARAAHRTVGRCRDRGAVGKIVFDALPEPLPPIGELAELTVRLPALPESPTIPNAARHRGPASAACGRSLMAWPFAPVRLGRADPPGRPGAGAGRPGRGRFHRAYSEKALPPKPRACGRAHCRVAP